VVAEAERQAASGSQLTLNVEEMGRSVNYRLLDTGWAYPTFYSKLYPDLRQALTATLAVPAFSCPRNGAVVHDFLRR
jgi:uncharacterized protein YicC (UPF0701 family)